MAEAHPALPLPYPAEGRAGVGPGHLGVDLCSTVPQVSEENTALPWLQAGRRNGEH